jgi:hypothetical protein
LPRRGLTPEEAISLVGHLQRGNHKAKRSHYRHHPKRRDKP